MIGTRAVVVAGAAVLFGRVMPAVMGPCSTNSQRVSRAEGIRLVVDLAVTQRTEGRFHERTDHHEQQQQGKAPIPQQGINSWWIGTPE